LAYWEQSGEQHTGGSVASEFSHAIDADLIPRQFFEPLLRNATLNHARF